METQNLANTLLRGSHNIDQMRQEIHELVQMMIGFARSSVARGTSEVRIEETFEHGSFRWDVEARMGAMTKEHNFFEVRCWSGSLVCSWSSSSASITMVASAGRVIGVHESMEAFVKGMLRVMPKIARELEPFIKAAQISLYH